MSSHAAVGRPVRILVADDNPLWTEGLSVLMNAHKGIEIVGRARDGNDAVELAFALRPDVVLMDVQMPNLDGIEATRILTGQLPSVRVLMLSSSTAPDDVARSRCAGAVGYVFKGCASAELVDLIHEVALTADSHAA